MGIICGKPSRGVSSSIHDDDRPEVAPGVVREESIVEPDVIKTLEDYYNEITMTAEDSLALQESGVYPSFDVWTVFDRGETLGKGGYGEVVIVSRKKKLSLNYTIKEIPDSSIQYAMKSMKKIRKEKPTLESFLNELNTHSQLHSDHVADMICGFVSEDGYHILTQLCLGGEVFDRVVSVKRFSENKASIIVRQMLLALEHCHEHNIVHRDLKPSNFVFESRDGSLEDQKVMLIDFGLAKHVEENVVYKDKVGTPFYVAPETIDSRHPYYVNRNGMILKCSDMWSMGAIVFVLVTGKLPFPGRKHRDIFKNITRCRFKFPDTLLLSDSLKDFISSLLKLDPTERLTCVGALEHPWISKPDLMAPSVPLDELVTSGLQQFQHGTKLQKALAKVAVNFLTDRDKQMLQDLFAAYDHDNSGSIELSELIHLLKDNGFSADDAENEALVIMEDLDTNRDGALSVAQFAQLAARPRVSIGGGTMVRRTFEAIDKDHDGYVTKDEVKYAFGEELNEDYMKLIFSETDANGDGRLTFDEFLSALKKTISASSQKKKPRSSVFDLNFKAPPELKAYQIEQEEQNEK